jgi:RNA polymerase sigma factor (sigma-70 family)
VHFDEHFSNLLIYSTQMTELPLEESVEESLMQKVDVKRLHEALNALSVDERSLIHAIYYCNQNQKTLAKELGITQQGVSRRLSAVLKKLRSMLTDLAV